MDKARLEYEMKKRNVTIAMICEHMRISRSAWYRKCNGMSQFTQSEIQSIMDYLQLKSPVGIFLPMKCLKRHRKELPQCRSRLILSKCPRSNDGCSRAGRAVKNPSAWGWRL